MMLLTPADHEPHLRLHALERRHDLPESFRPLVAIGGMVVVLLGVLQLMGNQFGFDRDGFRSFVLCAAPRRDILLGKNLSFAPVALGMAAILLTIVQMVCPDATGPFSGHGPAIRFDVPPVLHFYQFTVDSHTGLCRAGSVKPSQPSLKTVLLQIVMFAFLFPLTQAPRFCRWASRRGSISWVMPSASQFSSCSRWSSCRWPHCFIFFRCTGWASCCRPESKRFWNEH